MAIQTQAVDRRLLGTWQSDRRRTFKDYAFKPSVPPTSVRKLKAIFGKLKVRWTRQRCETDLDGFKGVERYELVAQDAESVVVRLFDALDPAGRLRHIHFEGDYYWIWAGVSLREYFRRVN